ncbi:MAG: MerR family transcriptional regulator [Betaproteobacteria bacterium HGW-Betaproteobacteria-11]|nr:MAG: MerR family transcriptional regulator [Betaproteobacteria bacterium HGW-Betaproteobacteria-11]
MSEHALTIALQGSLLEEQTPLSLAELCRACSVQTEWVMALVAEGVLDPAGTEPGHWRFTSLHLHRAGIARRLQHDLDINLPGIALALQLLDEIEDLQSRLHSTGQY